MTRELEVDEKRYADLEELGSSAGTGIYVMTRIAWGPATSRVSVDICTLTDASLDAWLDTLDAAALRRTCRVLLGRSPLPACAQCGDDRQVCIDCRQPGVKCRCPESSLPTPMPCPMYEYKPVKRACVPTIDEDE